MLRCPAGRTNIIVGDSVEGEVGGGMEMGMGMNRKSSGRTLIRCGEMTSPVARR